jgi:hypothetical protein
MFLSYLALCPFAFLCVSCGSIEWGRHWREILSFGYFLEAYSIQFGIVLGVALVMPLANNVDDFSEIIYERSSAARIESATPRSLPVIEVLLRVYAPSIGDPGGASRGAWLNPSPLAAG